MVHVPRKTICLNGILMSDTAKLQNTQNFVTCTDDCIRSIQFTKTLSDLVKGKELLLGPKLSWENQDDGSQLHKILFILLVDRKNPDTDESPVSHGLLCIEFIPRPRSPVRILFGRKTFIDAAKSAKSRLEKALRKRFPHAEFGRCPHDFKVHKTSPDEFLVPVGISDLIHWEKQWFDARGMGRLSPNKYSGRRDEQNRTIVKWQKEVSDQCWIHHRAVAEDATETRLKIWTRVREEISAHDESWKPWEDREEKAENLLEEFEEALAQEFDIPPQKRNYEKADDFWWAVFKWWHSKNDIPPKSGKALRLRDLAKCINYSHNTVRTKHSLDDYRLCPVCNRN